jgi:hypothetical protein
MPDQVFRNLEEWLRQALARVEAGLPIDCNSPDYRLLVSQWTDWPRGILAEPAPVADRPHLLSFSFRKPSETEETTERQLPVVWLFLVRLHCIAGGRVAIEVHSSSENNHYPRCYLPGRRPGGDIRRFYVLRQLSGTQAGYQTVEPSEFHVYDPADLGKTLKQPPGSTHAWIGQAEDIRDTLDAIREAKAKGKRLPVGATEERVEQMLRDGYRLLKQMVAPSGVETGVQAA